MKCRISLSEATLQIRISTEIIKGVDVIPVDSETCREFGKECMSEFV